MERFPSRKGFLMRVYFSVADAPDRGRLARFRRMATEVSAVVGRFPDHPMSGRYRRRLACRRRRVLRSPAGKAGETPAVPTPRWRAERTLCLSPILEAAKLRREG